MNEIEQNNLPIFKCFGEKVAIKNALLGMNANLCRDQWMDCNHCYESSEIIQNDKKISGYKSCICLLIVLCKNLN